MTIQTLPISILRPTEAYLCKESLDFLRHNTSAAEEPLEVVVDEQDRYLLMDGHNRACLALTNGKETVRVKLHHEGNTPKAYGLCGLLGSETDKCSCMGIYDMHALSSRILPTRAEVIAQQSRE